MAGIPHTALLVCGVTRKQIIENKIKRFEKSKTFTSFRRLFSKYSSFRMSTISALSTRQIMDAVIHPFLQITRFIYRYEKDTYI